jgi:hypothetical protein
MAELYYYECQHINRIFVLVIIIPCSVGMMIFGGSALYEQLILGIPFGDEPMSDAGLVFFMIFALLFRSAISWLLLAAKLELKVEKMRVGYRFFPFLRGWKYIAKEKIESWTVGKYFALGYGIHFGFKYTTLNAKGNMALHLQLKKSRPLRIGTQKPDELRRIMQKYYY